MYSIYNLVRFFTLALAVTLLYHFLISKIGFWYHILIPLSFLGVLFLIEKLFEYFKHSLKEITEPGNAMTSGILRAIADSKHDEIINTEDKPEEEHIEEDNDKDDSPEIIKKLISFFNYWSNPDNVKEGEYGKIHQYQLRPYEVSMDFIFKWQVSKENIMKCVEHTGIGLSENGSLTLEIGEYTVELEVYKEGSPQSMLDGIRKKGYET